LSSHLDYIQCPSWLILCPSCFHSQPWLSLVVHWWDSGLGQVTYLHICWLVKVWFSCQSCFPWHLSMISWSDTTIGLHNFWGPLTVPFFKPALAAFNSLLVASLVKATWISCIGAVGSINGLSAGSLVRAAWISWMGAVGICHMGDLASAFTSLLWHTYFYCCFHGLALTVSWAR